MTYNSQKTPLTQTLNRFTEGKIADGGQLDPKSLPCTVNKVVSSGIVEVKFEIQQPTNDPTGSTLPSVTVPVAWGEYIRYPVQAGDKGFCVAADAYLGGVSGLGGGVASLVMQGNLAALTFQPLGNTEWAQTPDAKAVVVYGVGGRGVTLLSDIGGQKVKLVLTDSGIVITGNVTINGDVQVNGKVTATGDVVAAGISLDNHIHDDEDNGPGTTGPPVGG